MENTLALSYQSYEKKFKIVMANNSSILGNEQLPLALTH